jgi:hypothetical protein
LDDQHAIDLARKAIVGKAKSDDDAPITVTHKRNMLHKLVIVEFGAYNPPGTRGPDFAARVTLDAKTGEVKDLQVG